MASRLNGKWVLVTGASAGFGAATARAFGAEGARLLIGARRLDRLEGVAGESKKAGAAEAHFHFLDVGSTKSVNEFMAWTRERINATAAANKGKLDVLINNAGGAHGLDTVAEGKDEDWQAMIESNVLGLLRVTRAALPLMLDNPGGSIINVGSHASRYAYEGGGAYCGAKAAELQITRTLRLELSGTGLRVCTVDPGLAETEFSITRFKGDVQRAKKVYEGTYPLVSEDIAEIIVWVASRPDHVNIDELIVKPTDQAAMHKVYRRKS
jgi:3-hydroxy acid dehydrogenase / malonic semialdehyde reductase